MAEQRRAAAAVSMYLCSGGRLLLLGQELLQLSLAEALSPGHGQWVPLLRDGLFCSAASTRAGERVVAREEECERGRERDQERGKGGMREEEKRCDKGRERKRALHWWDGR